MPDPTSFAGSRVGRNVCPPAGRGLPPASSAGVVPESRRGDIGGSPPTRRFLMNGQHTRAPHRRALFAALAMLGGAAFSLSLAGCKGSDGGGAAGKLKVAYLGLTCEAP